MGKRRRREEKNIVREIMLVVGVLRVRTRMAKMRKNKMKGVVLMCLVVVTSRKGRWIRMIIIIMGVNVRLPMLRNVIGERIVLREIMEKRGITRRIRMI